MRYMTQAKEACPNKVEAAEKIRKPTVRKYRPQRHNGEVAPLTCGVGTALRVSQRQRSPHAQSPPSKMCVSDGSRSITWRPMSAEAPLKKAWQSAHILKFTESSISSLLRTLSPVSLDCFSSRARRSASISFSAWPCKERTIAARRATREKAYGSASKTGLYLRERPRRTQSSRATTPISVIVPPFSFVKKSAFV